MNATPPRAPSSACERVFNGMISRREGHASTPRRACAERFLLQLSPAWQPPRRVPPISSSAMRRPTRRMGITPSLTIAEALAVRDGKIITAPEQRLSDRAKGLRLTEPLVNLILACLIVGNEVSSARTQ